MTKHIPHFEVLRGVAALWVLISHVFLITDIRIPFLSNGDQAVEVFIILSGFVIALMMSNEREPYGRYIFRRFVRLYPLFLMALAYGALTDHLYPPVLGSSPWLEQINTDFQMRQANFESAPLTHLLLHLTMLHGAVPDTILPEAQLMFSGPLWSISLEWQFYLIAPFLIALVSFSTPRKAIIAIGILLVTIALQHFALKYWSGKVPSFLPLRLPLFVVGIMAAVLFRQAREAPISILAGALVIAFLLSMFLLPSKLPLLMWFGVYFAAAVRDKIWVTRKIDQIVSSSIPRFVGQVSYGLYVLHFPTMLLISYYVVIPLMGDQSRWLAAAAILGLTLAATLVLAYLSYRFVEYPAIRWARRVAGRGARKATAGA